MFLQAHHCKLFIMGGKFKVANKASRKSVGKKYQKEQKVKNPIESVIIFGLGLFALCLVLIRGENIWYGIHNFILGLFGTCSILWPILLLCISVFDALGKSGKNVKLKIWMSVVTIILSCSLFYVFSYKIGQSQNANWFNYILEQYKQGSLNKGSGFFGALLGAPLIWAFGVAGARITNIIVLFVCIMFLTSTTLLEFFNIFSKPAKAIKNKIEDRSFELKNRKESRIDINIENERKRRENPIEEESADPLKVAKSKIIAQDMDDISKVTEKFVSKIKAESYKSCEKSDEKQKDEKETKNSVNSEESESNEYNFPPIDLLNKSIIPKDGDISTELNNNGKMLVDILKSFNVQTKIVDISRGPAVTRYELQPASGVKISKITTLADDIALNLAASGVRIEAPIPGKAAVGVEIPNKVVSVVNMRELISSSKFTSSKSKLTVVLGRDISGNIMTADLSKMPHLLIAGSTGSGKSVCINSFIISILYNARPDEVKLLMVDPKVVELGVYNGIPHLLVPVVTDPRKAAGALNWAVNEMLNRYKKFAENNVRDLVSYNELIESNPCLTDKEGEVLEKLPQIVIIIDELSDLMMAAPNEVEDYICRLAQMARAAGMHLVIATQRPSVDVITGIIKANIPSRIALAVSSQIDSRTILDMSGAEKLLGRGDMLFAPVGSPKPIRVQGCFVTDREIEKIVNNIKKSQESEYDSKVAAEIEKNAVPENSKGSDSQAQEGSMDPVMNEAIKCVIEAGQASTSLLQRRLRVGYARAGRLVDEMEQMGIVGPYEGSKPRQVLINYQQFMEMNMNRQK